MPLAFASILIIATLLLGCGKSEVSLETVANLDSLTPEQAKVLVNHAAGNNWNITLLKNIHPEQAELLSESPGGALPLTELRELTPATAEILAGFSGALLLDKLNSVSEETAAKLSQHKNFLSLNGLRTLNANVATKLAQHTGYLCLNGLQTLDATAAAALTSHNGFLSLDGIVEIPTESLIAVCNRKSGTSLNGITTLKNVHVGVIAKAQGLIFLRGASGLTSTNRKKILTNSLVFLGPN